jgi:DNA-binding NarL/FixJ family response regulator
MGYSIVKERTLVFIVEKNITYVDALIGVLSQSSSVDVVGISPSVGVFLTCDVAADVLIIDPTPEAPSGVAAVRRVRALRPMLKIIVLTLLDPLAYRASLVSSGADVVLSKSKINENLIDNLHKLK